MFTIKKNALYWIVTIFLTWIFPPFGLTLLFTKKGNETLTEKFQHLRRRSFRKLLVLYITLPVFIVLFAVADKNTQSQLEPIFENFSKDGELKFEFVDKSGSYVYNREIILTFYNHELIRIQAVQGWRAYMTLSYSKTMGLSGYKIILGSTESCGDLLTEKGDWVTGCDKKEFTLKFGSKNKMYYNTKTNTVFKYSYLLALLGFWSVIPKLYIVEIPKEIEPNVFDGEVQSEYSRVYNSKERSTSSSQNFDAKVFITKGSFSPQQLAVEQPTIHHPNLHLFRLHKLKKN
jgi:hypothetical protein